MKFLFVLVSLLSCMATSFAVGGWSAVPVDDAGVVDAASFAVVETYGKDYSVSSYKIVSAEQQVVAGLNYKLRIDTTLSSNGCKSEDFVVWNKFGTKTVTSRTVNPAGCCWTTPHYASISSHRRQSPRQMLLFDKRSLLRYYWITISSVSRTFTLTNHSSWLPSDIQQSTGPSRRYMYFWVLLICFLYAPSRIWSVAPQHALLILIRNIAKPIAAYYFSPLDHA